MVLARQTGRAPDGAVRRELVALLIGALANFGDVFAYGTVGMLRDKIPPHVLVRSQPRTRHVFVQFRALRERIDSIAHVATELQQFVCVLLV